METQQFQITNDQTDFNFIIPNKMTEIDNGNLFYNMTVVLIPPKF